MTILSILIPTIESRKTMFWALYGELQKQREIMPIRWPGYDVEILFDDSKRFLDGGLSIGKKREALVQRAQGKYLCFVDDDENVSPDYLQSLVELCLKDKDIVTFRNFSKLEPFWTVIDFSLFHPDNEEAKPDRVIKRKPWHMCPVRSEFAKQHLFDDISYGEDWKWFSQVLSHCKTEAKTDKVLHQYNHGQHSEADKITENEKLLAK
jgi:hypothetical protein